MNLTANEDESSLSSRTRQSSFGLLDDRLLNGSLDSLLSSRITDKPPIPTKPTTIPVRKLQQQPQRVGKLYDSLIENKNGILQVDQKHNYADEASEKRRTHYEKSSYDKTDDFTNVSPFVSFFDFEKSIDVSEKLNNLTQDSLNKTPCEELLVPKPTPTPPSDSFQSISDAPHYGKMSNREGYNPATALSSTIAETSSSFCAKSITTTNGSENITFSINHTVLSASNFSFTLNTSESGEFLIKKSENGHKSKHNLTKAIPNQLTQPQLKKSIDSKPMQLEVSDHLDAVKSNAKISSNMLSIDEKISPIQTQQTKSKKASGSLTSTPSKMTKSTSETFNLSSTLSGSNHMEKFYKCSTSCSYSDQLFKQEQRTNDSASNCSSNHDYHQHAYHYINTTLKRKPYQSSLLTLSTTSINRKKDEKIFNAKRRMMESSSKFSSLNHINENTTFGRGIGTHFMRSECKLNEFALRYENEILFERAKIAEAKLRQISTYHITMVEDFKREVSELRAELKAQSAKNDSDSDKEKRLPKKAPKFLSFLSNLRNLVKSGKEKNKRKGGNEES